MNKNVTLEQYKDLQDAYNYLNKKLFDNELPECLITLNRKRGAMGYYWHEKFSSRYDKTKISELSLNPDTFESEPDIEILSTLAHEMVHVWQYHFGDPSRKGYHNWEFSNKMQDIGLQTSSTGEEGGKPVGQKMSDYIIDNGVFEKVGGAFLLNSNKFHWNSNLEQKKLSKEKNKTREKFACPDCLQNAWAKKTAKIMCGKCEVHMVIEES